MDGGHRLAGIAVAASRFKALITESWLLTRVALWCVIVGICLLFVSVGITAIISWFANKHLSIKRQLMAMLMKQKIELLMTGVKEQSLGVFGRNVIAGNYLSDKLRVQFVTLDALDNLGFPYDRLVLVLEACTASGYVLIVATSVPQV